MNNAPRDPRDTLRRCYPSGAGRTLRLAGFGLIGLGALLLLLSISYWVWLTLLGLVLIAAGILLAR